MEKNMFKIKTKVLSSLEKCFIDENVDKKEETTSFSVLKGQMVCFQLACMRKDKHDQITFTAPIIEGDLKEYVTVREVINVPSTYPAPIFDSDEFYLRKEIGLYPDPIRPLHYNGQLCLRPKRLHCLWFEVNIPKEVKAGKYKLSICLGEGPTEKPMTEKKEINIELLDLELPKQRLIHT